MRRANAESTTTSVTPETLPPWLMATLLLLSLAVFINYIDRGNLATAAVLIQHELGLSATQLGFLLTAFFITYAPMQIVVGWLADRFGPGRVLIAGFIVWSLAMALTGLAHHFVTLVVLRVLLGLGESVSFPATSSIIARNFPESRRGFANAVVAAGYTAGPAFGIFFGGLLIAGFGWRSFFIAFGLLSLLWLIPWLAIAQPRLEQQHATQGDTEPDMRAILRRRSLWGTGLGLFCNNYVWYFTLSWMPYYLVHERHWSTVQMARIGGSAYLLLAVVVMATGWLSDRWIARGASPTRVRKSLMGTSSALVALCILGCAAAGADASVVWLMFACAAMGLNIPNIYAVSQTLAGARAAGRWVGIQNCIGNLAGLVSPLLTGVLVDRSGDFMLAFMITAGMSLVGGIFWVFLVGAVAPIDWSKREQPPAAIPAVAPI